MSTQRRDSRRPAAASAARMMCITLVLVMWCGGSARGQNEPSPDPALRDYLSATGLLNRGMNELAIAEYRKFLNEHGSHEKAPLARYGLGVALFRTKAYDEAIVELTNLNAPANFEFAAEAKLVLGQCQLEKHSHAEAAKSLGALLKSHPEHDLADDAAALQAEALYRGGDYKAVRAPVELLVSRWPQSALRERTEFFAALALVAQEDFIGAVKTLSDMAERFPQGQFADRVTLLLAQSQHRTGALDEARPRYQAVIERVQAGSGGGGGGDLVAEAKFGLGTILQQQKQYDEAGKLFDQVIKDFPKHPLVGPAQLQRGRVWFELGEYEQALASLERADRVEHAPAAGPPQDETAYWIAKCRMRLGDPKDAAARLTRAIEQFPQSKLIAEMSYDRAVALKRSGDPEAGPALASFVSKFPDHSLAPDALYLHAVTEHEQQRYEQSGALCDAFLKRFKGGPLAAPVSFLAAENDFLSDKLAEAAQKYSRFIEAHPQDEQADEAKFRLGTALYRLDRAGEALQAFSHVVNGRQTPEAFRRGLLMVGDIHYQQGQWEQAAALLDDYLSFGTEQLSADDALLKRGLALGMMNHPDQALASFDAIVQQFPTSIHRVQAIFERGQILLAQKKHDAAAEAFNQVLQSKDNERFAPYATNHLASIALNQQQYDKAAELYAVVASSDSAKELAAEASFQRAQALMAARQFEAAAAAFATLVELHPKSERVPLAQAQRAIALARHGDEAGALKLIEALEKKHAEKLPAELLASIAYEKAWCLREQGKTDAAAEAYKALLAAHQRQPIAAHAMLELAELEAAAERHAEARDLLRQLREFVADQGMGKSVPASVKEQGTYRLAVASFKVGQFDEAASLCEELMRDYPNSALLASTHLFCGESLFNLNKIPQATQHFSTVVEKYKDDPACANSLLRLGECHAASGNWAESEKAFSVYLKRFADSELWFQAQFGHAFALENQQRPDDAIAGYRKVIERHSGPTAARAQFQIGECLFAKKKYDEAVRELLKVDILYAYPQWSAAALYEAGRCFEELAKPAEAKAQFEQVQDKYPDTEWAKLASQRLTAMSSRSTGGG